MPRVSIDNVFSRLPHDSYALIDSETLLKRLGERDAPFLLDIRRRNDWEKSHISGSVQCEWKDVGALADSGGIPLDRDIAVICYVGQSSGQVTGVLRCFGYRAYSLLDGFRQWSENGFPTQASS